MSVKALRIKNDIDNYVISKENTKNNYRILIKISSFFDNK